MPLYEYDCAECGRRFEKLLPIDQRDSVARCLHCDASQIVRGISRFSSPRPRQDSRAMRGATRQEGTLLSISDAPTQRGPCAIRIENCRNGDISNCGLIGSGTVVSVDTKSKNIRFKNLWQESA